MARPKKYVSKSAVARELGVTPGRVTQMIARGMPARPDGRLDLERCRKWYRDNVTPRVKPAGEPQHSTTTAVEKCDTAVKEDVTRPADDGTPEGFLVARARREAALASLRELDLAKQRGELVPVADVENEWCRICATVRNRILLLPDKLAPRVAVLSDVLECREAIRREIYEALTALSEHDLA